MNQIQHRNYQLKKSNKLYFSLIQLHTMSNLIYKIQNVFQLEKKSK